MRRLTLPRQVRTLLGVVSTVRGTVEPLGLQGRVPELRMLGCRPAPAEAPGRAASNLSRTLRNPEGYGLVKLHLSPDTRAVRPEALTTEFLVALD